MSDCNGTHHHPDSTSMSNNSNNAATITATTTTTKNSNNNQDSSTATKNAVGPGVPPDGGWGWVVVVASFSISLLVDGVCFSFGIFFDEFQRQFETNRAVTSWIGSVLNGSYLLFGPIVSILVNIYGCRKVAMGGAVMASVAFFISTYSHKIGLLIFTYGFLGGTGFGLMYLPAIVMVGYYFERRRALATGIACCGSGIGAFLFAPLSEYLLHEYGWKGATWILAALVFHGLLFSMFYRPLPPPASSENCSQSGSVDLAKAGLTDTGEETVRLMTAADIEELGGNPFDLTDTKGGVSKNKQVEVELKNKVYECLKSDPGFLHTYGARSLTLHPLDKASTSKLKSSQNNDIVRLAYSQDFAHSCHRNRKHAVQEQNGGSSHPNLLPLQRKDIFYSGSIWHLREFREVGSVEQFRREMTGGASGTDLSQSPTSGNFLQAFTSIFDISLLRSPTFLVYGMSCFLCMAGFFVPFIYMPTHAVDMGVDSTHAALLISIIGITNTVGRVGVGFISDQPWADCLIINNVALIIGGVATVFVPFLPIYALLAVYAAVFGMAIAVFVSLRSIIMVELMGLEKLTTAFGFVIMCQGMSSFVGAPIAGAISDATGNYNAAFYLAGVTLSLSGIICIPLRRIAHWEEHRKKAGLKNINHKYGRAHRNGNAKLVCQEIEIGGRTNVEDTPIV